ncbi:hypothetical protein SGGMMB4_00861 [Sodalis glossinidius str. 'morsitans']|uniref:Uncharacterized protein n=1 Tax=Sodalis glossinidius (strain morsitans) TaxID=343509 RepID=Q2NW68_SODGM|nr:conserved hypothetical protein [Sodalis glossinidius str. 'morsitans']CRL44007.1 hypothetical protein SGGMMB4_00861 [Sodalis glossinidius str. 'morsitans']
MNAIIWPAQYQPGFTDNFVSNEVIAAGLDAADIWPWLNEAVRWPDYYTHAANVRFYDRSGPTLAPDVRFYFETFGFSVEAQVVEQAVPGAGLPGRLAWHG